jgi:hypothetical protein
VSVLDACRVCSKILCLVACKPEIDAEWERLHAEQDERERLARYTPPHRVKPPPRPLRRDTDKFPLRSLRATEDRDELR